MTGSCSAATPARTPATRCRHRLLAARGGEGRRGRRGRPCRPRRRPCHARDMPRPHVHPARARHKHDPGHDIAACHAAMTGGIGVLDEDAGYHSEANLAAPGPARLIADGKTSGLARREPAAGPPPADATPLEANAHRLRTPDGRAAYKRRAPDVEGLDASLKDQRGLRRFSLRGLHNRHQRVPLRLSRWQPPAAGCHQLRTCPCWSERSAQPCHSLARKQQQKPPEQPQEQALAPGPQSTRPGPEPGQPGTDGNTRRLPVARNCNSPYSAQKSPRSPNPPRSWRTSSHQEPLMYHGAHWRCEPARAERAGVGEPHAASPPVRRSPL